MTIQIIILIIVIVIILYLLYWRFSNFCRKDKNVDNKKNADYSTSRMSTFKNDEDFIIKNPTYSFDNIIESIKRDFFPKNVFNEEDCEKQLINFLNKKYPNKIFRHGHNSRGIKIDFVIEGTNAIELITLENEGKLLSLTDKILKLQQDFGKIAVILIDINKIDIIKIKEYAEELEKRGIKIIIKNIN